MEIRASFSRTMSLLCYTRKMNYNFFTYKKGRVIEIYYEFIQGFSSK